MRRFWTLLRCALLLAMLAACSGTRDRTLLPAQQELKNPAPRAGLPAFPPSDTPASAVRAVSDNTLAADGVDYAELVAGSTSYNDPAQPGALALVPAGGEALAWARYSFADIITEKPLTATLTLDAALDAPGGTALPLRCWIGVGDYTQAYWEWHGPYTQAGEAQLVLNAPADGETPARTDRYLSAAGTLQLLVVVDAAEQLPTPPDNPQGLCAALVKQVSVLTSLNYETNKPHYAAIESISCGAPAKAGATLVRGASFLQPAQFVYLAWTAVAPLSPADMRNTALDYLVYRQGLADPQPVQIGMAVSPSFTDPLDLAEGIAEPTAGAQYVYFLRAENTAGVTPLARSAPVVIPMLPPDLVTATLDNQEGFLRVSWSDVDGAVAYEIWRADTADSAQAEKLTRVTVFPATYLDNSALPGQVYWYFIKSEGAGDGNAANGLEPGALSDFSLGAQGLRRVLITVLCLGVEGDGSSQVPFQLVSGNSYQFTAVDQLGIDLTAGVDWTVDPPATETFSLTTPGLLENVAAGAHPIFLLASYGLLEYSWSKSAQCDVF